jgi:hypothetical protein
VRQIPQQQEEITTTNVRKGDSIVCAHAPAELRWPIVELDAISHQRFRGKIKSLSGTARSNVFSGDPSMKVDVTGFSNYHYDFPL